MTGKVAASARREAESVEGAERSHRTVALAEKHLQAALRRPQPSRERAWAREVATQLAEGREALAAHRKEVEGPEGLYDELRFEAPWLLGRVSQLTNQLNRIEQEAGDLSAEVERVAEGDFQPLPYIRADAERMLLSLRDVLTKETDLMFERFNQPAALD